MPKKWSDITNRQAAIAGIVGLVLLAIGTTMLDNTSDGSVLGMVAGIAGLLLLGVGVFKFFQ